MILIPFVTVILMSYSSMYLSSFSSSFLQHSYLYRLFRFCYYLRFISSYIVLANGQISSSVAVIYRAYFIFCCCYLGLDSFFCRFYAGLISHSTVLFRNHFIFDCDIQTHFTLDWIIQDTFHVRLCYLGPISPLTGLFRTYFIFCRYYLGLDSSSFVVIQGPFHLRLFLCKAWFIFCCSYQRLGSLYIIMHVRSLLRPIYLLSLSFSIIFNCPYSHLFLKYL